MCNYIETPMVAPGWGCCKCKTYNGLQRPECKSCLQTRHVIEIPEGLNTCKNCGFSVRGEMPTRSLEGPIKGCPCCGEPVDG